MNTKKLPAILEWLISRLETVEVVEPKDKVPKGATIVGVMSEEMQRLSCLRRVLCDEHNELVERGKQELETIDSRAEQKKTREHVEWELHVAKKKHEIVETLFWLGIRTKFPELAGKSSVGFGQGWRVFYQEKCDQCPRCTARREAGFSAPGIDVEIIKIPMDAGFLGELGDLLSRLRCWRKPDDSNETKNESDQG